MCAICVFTGKFGLRLYHCKDAAPVPALAKEMLRALLKAMRIVAKLMEPVARTQIAVGNVTIENSFCKLDNMYGYFRQQANRRFTEKPRQENPKVEDLGKLLSDAYQKKAAGAYNTMAMIDAFFSRLEHLLVILLAFSEPAANKPDLLKEIGGFWSDKFKRIFPFDRFSEAKLLHDRLSELREKRRNPIAHGNFQKDGKSLYFHFGSAGAISCAFSEPRPNSFIFLADKDDFDNACALFDEMDEFIAESPLKFGLLYAKSGLNVAYDAESTARYHRAATSEESFNDFLAYESYIADMHTNMDWLTGRGHR
jgi:hypothetical protein